jgi:hypothetical protein
MLGFVYLSVFAVLGIEVRASYYQSKHSTTEIHPTVSHPFLYLPSLRGFKPIKVNKECKKIRYIRK